MKFNQYEGMQTENNLRLSFQSESSVSGTELRDRKKPISKHYEYALGGSDAYSHFW